MNKLPEIKTDVTFKPGVVEFKNFDAVVGELKNYLDKFKVIISEDQVKDAKKDAAQLNKIKKAIKEKEKEIIKAYEEPIKEFKNKIKMLTELIDETREFVVSQVKKYEEEKKEEIREIISKFISDLYNLNNIPEEYRNLDVEKYVKLSAVTQTGKVTKATASEIERDINELMIQIEKDKLEALKAQQEKEALKQEIRKEVERELKGEEEVVDLDREDGVYEVVLVYRVKSSKSKDEIIKFFEENASVKGIKPIEIKIK